MGIVIHLLLNLRKCKYHCLVVYTLIRRISFYAEKIKVNPTVGASPFRAAQHAAVELARHIQISHMEGEVEKAFHGVSLSGEKALCVTLNLLLNQELLAPVFIGMEALLMG